MRKFYLLVPCTKTKTLPPSPPLCAGALPTGLTTADRAGLWVRQLAEARGPLTPARALYAGPAWAVVRRLARRVEEHGGTVLVVSAGYGLVGLDAPLAAYDATFTRGQPNSVAPLAAGGDERPAWWAAVSEWAGPDAGGPRTVGDLVRRTPGASFLAVLSEPYLRALGPDLAAARTTLVGGDLAVLGPRTKALAGLHLPYASGLRGQAGGPLATLGLRLAERLLEELAPADWCAAGFQQALSGWGDEAVTPAPARRDRLDDDAVVAFIRRELTERPNASSATLLARLRRSGRACGQERFERLYSQPRR